jgi:hypothetical protein
LCFDYLSLVVAVKILSVSIWRLRLEFVLGALVSLVLDWIGIHDWDCSVKFLVIGIVFFYQPGRGLSCAGAGGRGAAPLPAQLRDVPATRRIARTERGQGMHVSLCLSPLEPSGRWWAGGVFTWRCCCCSDELGSEWRACNEMSSRADKGSTVTQLVSIRVTQAKVQTSKFFGLIILF